MVRDPWLIAVINLVHEHHEGQALPGEGCIDVTIGNMRLDFDGNFRFAGTAIRT